MEEKIVAIETPDGRMETFITHPEQGGPFPPVIVFMDVWGVREQLFDIARRIGTIGYAVAVPNFYYREGGITFDYRHSDGKTISLSALDPAEQDKILSFLSHLTDEFAVSDTGAVLDYLASDDAVRTGPVGSVGYCLGGRLVIRAAGAFPDAFRASASLHGTRLVTEAPDSPHLEASRMQGEIYCGFGELDHYTPPDVIAAVRESFADATVVYSDLVHHRVDHGYAIPDRDVFDKAAAERDWERIFAMYQRQLRP
ncbi:MAG: dienelactone hydrolase family protein [Alphaproteobacteria bacterium]|nr:dienelactone hydrolase family protein [Alphaproteobacteria bacterium]